MTAINQRLAPSYGPSAQELLAKAGVAIVDQEAVRNAANGADFIGAFEPAHDTTLQGAIAMTSAMILWALGLPPTNAESAKRAKPETSMVAARFHALAKTDFDNANAVSQPKGKGWDVVAQGLGVPREQLIGHPKIRRAIELAAASNGKPAIFSAAEGRMLLRELDASTEALARLLPIREVEVPAAIRSIQIGPFARQILTGEFEGTVHARAIHHGALGAESIATDIVAPKQRSGENVAPLKLPSLTGDELQLTFVPKDGPTFTARIPRRSMTSGVGSAGYRSLTGIPEVTAYVA